MYDNINQPVLIFQIVVTYIHYTLRKYNTIAVDLTLNYTTFM